MCNNSIMNLIKLFLTKVCLIMLLHFFNHSPPAKITNFDVSISLNVNHKEMFCRSNYMGIYLKSIFFSYLEMKM